MQSIWDKVALAHLTMDPKYNSSTLLRAQGVRRKNFKLDLMLGS